jgi:hypothetical protein
LSEALVNDWAEYEFAGMDDPAPVIRARLSAIEAAVRADATRAAEAEVAALRAALEYVTHRSDCGHGHKDVIHIAPAHFTGPACPHCSDAEYADLMEREDPCLICAALAAQPAAPEPTTTAVPLDVPTREATPAAPEAEPVVILHGDEHDDPGGYCATCEALAKSAPEAEPERCGICGRRHDRSEHDTPAPR